MKIENPNYNIADLKEADARIHERWKKNKINLKFNKNDRILVVGTLNYINKINNLGTKKVFALDLENKPNFLNLKTLKNVKFKKTNLKRIYFKENYFDFIFCNGILSHLDNWMKILNEFYRVLKPQGKLWINVFGYSKFRRIPENINRKFNENDKKNINKILTIEKWNIQKIKYIENMFFWKKRILFKKKILEKNLKKIGFTNAKFCHRGTQSDLSEQVFKDKKLKSLFNDGDLRYLLSK